MSVYVISQELLLVTNLYNDFLENKQIRIYNNTNYRAQFRLHYDKNIHRCWCNGYNRKKYALGGMPQEVVSKSSWFLCGRVITILRVTRWKLRFSRAVERMVPITSSTRNFFAFFIHTKANWSVALHLSVTSVGQTSWYKHTKTLITSGFKLTS